MLWNNSHQCREAQWDAVCETADDLGIWEYILGVENTNSCIQRKGTKVLTVVLSGYWIME